MSDRIPLESSRHVRAPTLHVNTHDELHTSIFSPLFSLSLSFSPPLFRLLQLCSSKCLWPLMASRQPLCENYLLPRLDRSSLSRITYTLLKYNTQIERYYRSSRNEFLPSFFFPFFILFSFFFLLPLLPFLFFQTTSSPLTFTIVPTK